MHGETVKFIETYINLILYPW